MTSIDLPASTRAAATSTRQSQQLRILCVLFFFSGFPALIYQLTWQRELFLIFGVNIESVTIVVTAFMLGLGFGSLAGGWLSCIASATDADGCSPRSRCSRLCLASCRCRCSARSATSPSA